MKDFTLLNSQGLQPEAGLIFKMLYLHFQRPAAGSWTLRHSWNVEFSSRTKTVAFIGENVVLTSPISNISKILSDLENDRILYSKI